MKSISCIATVTPKGIKIPDTFLRDVSHVFSGEEIRIIVRKDYRKVSTKEHRFYRGPFLDTVMDVFIDAGHPFQKYNQDDRETVHTYLKRAFGPHEEFWVKDDLEYIPVSMSRWTTVQTEKYMEDIRVWMAEIFNAVLPYPNEAAPKEG